MPIFILNQLKESVHMDCVFSTVIRAVDEPQARELANKAHMDEGSIWEDHLKTSCEVLESQGEAKVIIQESNGF